MKRHLLNRQLLMLVGLVVAMLVLAMLFAVFTRTENDGNEIALPETESSGVLLDEAVSDYRETRLVQTESDLVAGSYAISENTYASIGSLIYDYATIGACEKASDMKDIVMPAISDLSEDNVIDMYGSILHCYWKARAEQAFTDEKESFRQALTNKNGEKSIAYLTEFDRYVDFALEPEVLLLSQDDRE